MVFKRALTILPFAIMFIVTSTFVPTGISVLDGRFDISVHAEQQGINQSASTSGGTVKRHIDISSPFSGGYIYEDMTVEGKASITESFTMDNMSPGTNAGSGFDDWDIGPSGGSSESAVEENPDTGSTEANSSTGSERNTGSGSSDSSEVAAKEKTNPLEDVVLGVSVVSYPSWLDLF